MLTQRRRITTSLLLILIVICAAALIINANKKYIRHKNQPNNPDAFMTDVHALQIDKHGTQRGILFSPKLVGYQMNDSTDIDKPFFILNMPHSPPWHLHANHGKAMNGMDKILLWGNVNIQQLPGPNSHNVTLITSKMTVFPNKSYATTNEPVTIKRPGSIIHAIGMTANLNTGDIKLLSKIQGQYGTETK